MLGAKPFRIDVFTTISGVTFATAYRTRVVVETAAGPIPFLSKANLVRNKRAAGRPKDLADIAELVTTGRRSRASRRT